MAVTPKKKTAKASAVARKVRAALCAPADNSVSGPTFFEISKRPSMVYFVNSKTGNAKAFDFKTAEFS